MKGLDAVTRSGRKAFQRWRAGPVGRLPPGGGVIEEFDFLFWKLLFVLHLTNNQTWYLDVVVDLPAVVTAQRGLCPF